MRRRRARPGSAAARRPASTLASRDDGRVQRGARNREAIVDALFALVGEGVPAPTAQEVAKRAAVGLRSVFRHFRDMDRLYAALDARLRGEAEAIVAGAAPRAAALARARALVARRAALFERVAPYERAASLARQRSRFLHDTHADLVSALRHQLRRWLPELARAPRAFAAAAEQASSFEAWDRLRGDQGLSPARARAAMEAAVCALVARAARVTPTRAQGSAR